MIGKSISRYRILEKIGEGGMGVVYKAEDSKLGRFVALKVLSGRSESSPYASHRFLREARTASALDHPNICTIYEIDTTSDGLLFIAMAFYEGRTLKERMAEGTLPLPEALNIADQVLQGLKKTHEKGIIHRDLKPSNIVITEDGIAKILDFGLAKLSGATAVTTAGSILGTMGYMSPEQARGEEVDHRSDLWSLGVIIYEMVAGQAPFSGDTWHSTLFAIIRDEPPALTSPHCSPQLDRLLRRALNKDRDARFQTAEEMLDELRALDLNGPDRKQEPSAETLVEPGDPAYVTFSSTKPSSVASAAAPAVAPAARSEPWISAETKLSLPAQKASILVLPFDDLSREKDNEYFSDGLTDEIITTLSELRELRVISRTSAMKLKGTERDIPQIARDLRLQYVVVGGVRKAGNNLRITAQLIDPAHDSSVWSDKYQGTLDDIFEIQEQVARSIVNALMLTLTPDESEKMSIRPFENVEAYDCYLRARHEILHHTQEGADRALEYLSEGLKMIGEHPLLYAGLSSAHWQYVNLGIKQKEHLEIAEEYAKKVFDLDPNSARGHEVLAYIETSKGNQVNALRRLRKAARLDPSSPEVLALLVFQYGVAGRSAQGYSYAERLLHIDPLNAYSFAMVSFLHLVSGNFETATTLGRKMYQIEPLPVYAWLYGQTLAVSGKHQDAVDILEDSLSRDSDCLWSRLNRCFLAAILGDAEAVKQAVSPELEKMVREDLQYSWFLAQTLSLIGESAASLRWLKNAVKLGFINYPLFSRVDPLLENVRKDPAFQEFMDEVRGKWESFSL